MTTMGSANKHTMIKTGLKPKWQPAARKINTRASWVMLLFAAPPAMFLSRIASVLKGCKLMQRDLKGIFACSPKPAQAPSIGTQFPCIDIRARDMPFVHPDADPCIQVEKRCCCFLSYVLMQDVTCAAAAATAAFNTHV